MKIPRTFIVATALLTGASLAPAQGQAPNQPQQPQQPNQPQQSQPGEDEVRSVDQEPKFFEVSLSDGGAYMVALSRITSIAKHEYIVDGSVRVNEVSITAEGSTITRFYFMAPVSEQSPSSIGQVLIDRSKDTVKKAAQRAGATGLLSAVSKSYPDGTHTHNVEFRLRNKANVSQLYSSLHDAWYHGRGKRISVQVKE